MTDTAEARADDIPGAIGTPIGIVSVVLAVIPGLAFVALLVLWIPGAAALILGIIGLRRNRGGRGPRTLSILAVTLGGIAVVITLGWLTLWVLVQLFSECMDVTVCG